MPRPDPNDPSQNPFLRIADGETPDQTETTEQPAQPEQSAGESAPEPQDWSQLRLPEDEKFYGRLRGKTLADADKTLRELEDDKRRAETIANQYERQLASTIAQLQYLQNQQQPKAKEPEPDPTPKLEVTVDEIAERPTEFAQKLVAAVTAQILPQIEKRFSKTTQDVDQKLEARSTLERVRAATDKAFRESNIPEKDYKETYDELSPLFMTDTELQGNGSYLNPENWKLAIQKRRQQIASRYGLAEAQAAPEPKQEEEAHEPEAPKLPQVKIANRMPAPQGNFAPAGKSQNTPNKALIKVSSEDRLVWESAGRAMGFEGDDLEGFVQEQAAIRNGLRATRKRSIF